MAEQLTKRGKPAEAAKWTPQVGDVVRIPGGGGIGKDLEGRIVLCNEPGHDGYVKVAISHDERNPPAWRGRNWPGRATSVELVFRPIPEETLVPEGVQDAPPGEGAPGPVGIGGESSDAGAASTEAAPAALEEDVEDNDEDAIPPNEFEQVTWAALLDQLRREGVHPASIALVSQAMKLRAIRDMFDFEVMLDTTRAIARLHPDLPWDSVAFFAEALQYMSYRGKHGRERTSLHETVQRLRQEYPESRQLLERALMVQDSLQKVPIPPAKVGPYTIHRSVEAWATVPVWGAWAREGDIPKGAEPGHVGTFDYVGGKYKPRPPAGATQPPMLSSPEAAVGWLVMHYQKTYGTPAPGLVATFPGEGHGTVGEEIAYWKRMEAEGRTVLPRGLYDRQRYAVAEAIAAAEKDLDVASWKGRGKKLFQARKPAPVEVTTEMPAWQPKGLVLVAGFKNGEAWLVEEHREGEWLVLFRERGKEDQLDPKNPLPFPTAEEAARAIGRRCRDDHEAKDRDVWRNGTLGLEGWLAYGEAVQEREMEDLRRRQETAAAAQGAFRVDSTVSAFQKTPEPASETLDLGAEFEEDEPEFHALKGPKGKKVAAGPAGYSVWEFGEGFRCYHDETGLVLRDMLDEPADFWSAQMALSYLRDVQCGQNAAAMEADEKVATVAPASPIPDNKGEGLEDPTPGEPTPDESTADESASQPALLEEPVQPKKGHHVGAMMTGDLRLNGAQVLAYFTEQTEASRRKKRPQPGEDTFGGVIYLEIAGDGFRLRRHGGAGFPVDRPLTEEVYGNREAAVAAARAWLWRGDPLCTSHYQYHFGCRKTVPTFITYNGYMNAVLREAGFNYKLVETADGRFLAQDYGVSLSPDGQGVYAAQSANGEARQVIRFEEVARIWNGLAHTRAGRRGSGSIIWCRDDIPDFPAPDFTETVNENGAVAWLLPDGRGFVAYPNEKHYTVTRKDANGFHVYADNLAEARAKCGVPAVPIGEQAAEAVAEDAAGPEPRTVALRFQKEGIVRFGIEPDADGEVRVLFRRPGGGWRYGLTVASEAAALDWVRSRWGAAPDGTLWAFADGFPGTAPGEPRRYVVDPKRLREGEWSGTAILGRGDIQAALSSHLVSDRDRDLTRPPHIAQPFEHDGRLWMTTGCDERVATACELVPLKEWEGPTLRYDELPRDSDGNLLFGYHGLKVSVSRRNWYVCRGASVRFEAWRVDPAAIYHHAPAPDTDDTANAGAWPPGVVPCAWDSVHAPRAVVGTRDGSWRIVAGCLRDETGRMRFRLYGLYQDRDLFEPLQDEVYDTPRAAWAAFGTTGDRPLPPAPAAPEAPVAARQSADPPAEARTEELPAEERPVLVLTPPDITPRRRRQVLA